MIRPSAERSTWRSTVQPGEPVAGERQAGAGREQLAPGEIGSCGHRLVRGGAQVGAQQPVGGLDADLAHEPAADRRVAEGHLDREPVDQRGERQRGLVAVGGREYRRAGARRGRSARSARASVVELLARAAQPVVVPGTRPAPSTGSSCCPPSRPRSGAGAWPPGPRRRERGRELRANAPRRRSAPRRAARPWTRTSRGPRPGWCRRARRRRRSGSPPSPRSAITSAAAASSCGLRM